MGDIHYRTSLCEEVVGPLSFRFNQLTSFESAVDDMYRQLDAQGRREQLEMLCPYFGVLWPGARALARWMIEQGNAAFADKRVLELGCGLALPSFLASWMGARALASDVHPHVPLFLARNLLLNRGIALSYRHIDWRRPDELPSREKFDWILASDVLYERTFAPALVSFIALHLSPRGEAVILDPNRSFWENLVADARRAGLQTRVRFLKPASLNEPPSSILIRISKVRMDVQ